MPDGGTTGGHFTYSWNDKVYRIDARAQAVAQDVSAELVRFGTGSRDRWLIPSSDGQWLAVSTDRLNCSLGECLAIAPAALSSLQLIRPGGNEVSLEGHPALSSNGDIVVYPSQEGPHQVDLWLSRRSGTSWSSAELISSSSSFEYNNMPAFSFDNQRILFDCGNEPYPESGGNSACEVRLNGSQFKVLVSATTLPNSREPFVQFPHDSIDGVLFQGSWPIMGDSPETIWLLPAAGVPTPIAKNFLNAVSPCGLPDGRFGMLWLGRTGNTSGAHELTLVDRQGALVTVLTPGVDVTDIGIGCSQ